MERGDASMITDYISLKELGERLDANRSTVRRAMQKAGVKPLVMGRCIRYRRDEVERALAGLVEGGTE